MDKKIPYRLGQQQVCLPTLTTSVPAHTTLSVLSLRRVPIDRPSNMRLRCVPSTKKLVGVKGRSDDSNNVRTFK